jgi:RNA polymerase sigma-70 factor (sigma-E family)
MGLEEFVAARGSALLRLAYVLTSNRHDAEDLVQSALVDAYRHWRRVVRADSPDAYVRRVLVNRHLAGRRRSSGGRPTDPTELDWGSVVDAADGVVARDETRRQLDALSSRARTVLVLRYYADLDDVAIAAAMGVSPSTVRSTAARALAQLRSTVSPPVRFGKEVGR